MLELVKVRIRVGIVYQLVQKCKSVPNGHFLLIELQEFLLFPTDEIISLISMVEAIKFTDGIPGRGFIVPVFFRSLAFGNRLRVRIAFKEIVLPYIQGGKRISFSTVCICAHGILI